MNSFQDTREDQLKGEQGNSPDDGADTVSHVVTTCSTRNCSCSDGCTSSNTVNFIHGNSFKVHRESSLLKNNLPITGSNSEFEKEEYVRDNCATYSSLLSPIEEVVALENQSTSTTTTPGGSKTSRDVFTNFQQSSINEKKKKTFSVEKEEKSEINSRQSVQAALSCSCCCCSSSSSSTQQCNCVTRELYACEVEDTQDKEKVKEEEKKVSHTKDRVKNNNATHREYREAIKSDTNHQEKCNGDVKNTGNVTFESPASDFINKQTEGERDISSLKVDATVATAAAAASSSVTRTSTSTGESVACQVKKTHSTSRRFSKVIQSLLPSLGRSKKSTVKVN